MELTKMTLVDEYRAGACNIGPAEIARRRRSGHVGAALTIVGGALLVAADAPPLLRAALFVPASIAAAGYIQAATRFCADYGWRGVFNFGDAGRERTRSVADDEARRADRRKALGIGAASAGVGLLATAVALAL